jgi:hypothetical protein
MSRDILNCEQVCQQMAQLLDSCQRQRQTDGIGVDGEYSIKSIIYVFVLMAEHLFPIILAPDGIRILRVPFPFHLSLNNTIIDTIHHVLY